MNTIDKSSLTSEEFAMYSQSRMKLQRSVEDMFALAELPPFAFDKNGRTPELRAEFFRDINQHLLEIDEEDFITDRYKPLVDIKNKYVKEIEEARQIRDSALTIGLAIKKWFSDNGLTMDESLAYSYGVE